MIGTQISHDTFLIRYLLILKGSLLEGSNDIILYIYVYNRAFNVSLSVSLFSP